MVLNAEFPIIGLFHSLLCEFESLTIEHIMWWFDFRLCKEKWMQNNYISNMNRITQMLKLLLHHWSRMGVNWLNIIFSANFIFISQFVHMCVTVIWLLGVCLKVQMHVCICVYACAMPLCVCVCVCDATVCAYMYLSATVCVCMYLCVSACVCYCE